jgi:hypothetical protein
MGTHWFPPTRVPEVPVKWTQPTRSPVELQVGQEPYPQSQRPWKTADDLIRTPEDLPGLWHKLLPRS